MEDPGVLTMEKLRGVMREIEMKEIDLDLDMFLSDQWTLYCILKNGGRIIQGPDGHFYAVARSVFEPSFAWKPLKY